MVFSEKGFLIMSKPKTGPQDLPPKGGYAPYQIDRIKLRNVIKGRYGAAILIAANVIGFPLYYKNWVIRRKDMLEHRSTELAILPMLCAEQDRAILKQLKHLRDLEADVMKDFPFWEVGTLFGVPIYESIPKDKYVKPRIQDMYMFTDVLDPPFMAIDYLYT
ncbi:NADH dehydrogenase (ubiquinone) B16.6 subunit [Xylocopa sonorina]|uniref:NADH dehydrogenase (ubiquinone) B16.6 subunit n=1 Tax=Xylocopa sonorina TaxID=1818115 RepID=UPI00403B020F